MTKLISCTCTSHSRTIQGEVKYNKRQFEALDGLSRGWTSDGRVISTHLDLEKHSDLGKRSGFMKGAIMNNTPPPPLRQSVLCREKKAFTNQCFNYLFRFNGHAPGYMSLCITHCWKKF